ncbi:MAG: enolase C-terminal domain-like protein [Pseudomonadota bacterium]
MPQLTIDRVKTHAVLAPLARPITTAAIAIEKAPLLLIDVEMKEGVVGRSYLFTYTPRALRPLSALIAELGETLIGADAAPETRYEAFERTFLLLGRQGLLAMAIAGLDMAFWDAQGRARGESLAALLGAAPAPIPCYDSHGAFQPGRDDAALAQSLADGFDAVKVKIGGAPEADLAALKRVREIIGPETRLMVDYNQSLSAPEAILRIQRLENEIALDWVEEPVRAEDYAGHRAIRAAVRTPIQTGENWWLPEDAARAISFGISDHAMLDVMKIGGVTGWRRAAALAHAASLPISSHLFIEASAHVLAATPGRHRLEFLDVAASVLEEPWEVEDGALTPKGPGLGLSWRAEALSRYAA